MLTTAARTMGMLAHPERIKEMDEELSKVIDDFDRAVNVEALRVAKETGERSLSQSGDGSCSAVLCRATAFALAARICQSQLRLGSPLYGRHSPVYP